MADFTRVFISFQGSALERGAVFAWRSLRRNSFVCARGRKLWSARPDSSLIKELKLVVA